MTYVDLCIEVSKMLKWSRLGVFDKAGSQEELNEKIDQLPEFIRPTPQRFLNHAVKKATTVAPQLQPEDPALWELILEIFLSSMVIEIWSR